VPYRVPARRSTLLPNHDGSPGRRLWFPPQAAGLGKVVSASATRFPDDGKRLLTTTAALGGVTAVGGLAALPMSPLLAACATALGALIGTGALVVRGAATFTTWVGAQGLAVVRRQPLEPAQSLVLLFEDVDRVERRVLGLGRLVCIEDRWMTTREPQPALVIAARVDAEGSIEPDAARFDALPPWHPHHFARAARRAYASWRSAP
jgi:hypothetical protein